MHFTINPIEYIYKTENGQALSYYAFFPNIDPKSCIVCIHGGGWRSDNASRMFRQCEYFAQSGIVGISIDYRLLDENTDVRNGLADCAYAIDSIRKMLFEKYKKNLYIIALGDSAGGYYATCLGNEKILAKTVLSISRVDFVVDLNGIVDLTEKWSYGLSGDHTIDFLCEYSPLFNVSKYDAPTLIVHGDEDKTVKIEDSFRYLAALKAKGVPCDLKELKGAKHAFILFDYTHDNTYVVSILKEILQYLQEKGLV